MTTRPRNRFDVQVVFPDIAFGIKNRADVELTRRRRSRNPAEPHGVAK